MTRPARSQRPLRRTQEERSAETRHRILDAAVECLASHGYAGTTTTGVADRAGVSRGAQLHHFPTRASLVTAAVQHLFTNLTAEYDKAFASLSPDADRVGAAIDLLWNIMQDPRLAAVLELYVAGRTDPELRAELAPVAERHHQNVLRLARAYFPEAAVHRPRFDTLLGFLLDTLQGAAVRTLLVPRHPAALATVAAVKRHARTLLGALAAAPPRSPRR